MKSSTKVLFIQRVFAHYRKPIIDRVSKLYIIQSFGTNLNLGIKKGESIYYKNVKYIKYYPSNSTLYLFSWLKKIRFNPKVIVIEFAIGILNIPILILFSKIFNRKLILWSHGYDRKKGFEPYNRLSDRYRLILMKWCDAVLLYSNVDKIFLSNFIKSEKIFVAQNTLDTDNLLAIREKLEHIGVTQIKVDRSYKQKYILTFIGRMVKDKKPELLIDVYEYLKTNNIDVAIHFIGKGELYEKIYNTIIERNYIEDFHFHGWLHNEEQIGEILYCSDLIINPGYLGLSINHAFCFDTPIISFMQTDTGPFHSPEVEYIVNKKNSFLIKNKNINLFMETIIGYLKNEKEQKRVKREIRKTVNSSMKPSKMVKGIDEAIKYVLK